MKGEGLKLTDLVKLPKETIGNLNFKFIQLCLKGKPVLLVGKGTDFHRRILADFLSQSGVKFETKHFDRDIEGPSLIGKDYDVVGMGTLVIIREYESKTAIFGGESADYRIGVDENHLEMLKKHNEGWYIYGYTSSC